MQNSVKYANKPMTFLLSLTKAKSHHFLFCSVSLSTTTRRCRCITVYTCAAFQCCGRYLELEWLLHFQR